MSPASGGGSKGKGVERRQKRVTGNKREVEGGEREGERGGEDEGNEEGKEKK